MGKHTHRTSEEASVAGYFKMFFNSFSVTFMGRFFFLTIWWFDVTEHMIFFCVRTYDFNV